MSEAYVYNILLILVLQLNVYSATDNY